jgi:hypothetical protein
MDVTREDYIGPFIEIDAPDVLNGAGKIKVLHEVVRLRSVRGIIRDPRFSRRPACWEGWQPPCLLGL